MKATMGLLLAFIVFFTAVNIASLVGGGPFPIEAYLSLAIFYPLLAILLFFTWRGKPWANVGTGIFGVFVAVAAAAPSAVDPLAPAGISAVLALVLGLLMALEGFKAYSELRQAKT
jgi:hypothetical protein